THLRPARFREDSLRLPASERLGCHTLLPRGQEFSEETCEPLLLPLRLKEERPSEVGGDKRVLSVGPTAIRRPFVGRVGDENFVPVPHADHPLVLLQCSFLPKDVLPESHVSLV